MKAQLIGEKSAGMTAVEIYNHDDLVWSHRYFDDGATHQGYINGLCQAWDDMKSCADVADYEGGMVDGNGEPELMDCNSYTGIMLEYDSDTNVWTIGEDARRLGQGSEIVDACMVVGLIDQDGEDDTYVDGDVVQSIVRHIMGAEEFTDDLYSAVRSEEISEDSLIEVDVWSGPIGGCGFRSGYWSVKIGGINFEMFASVPHSLDLFEQEKRLEDAAHTRLKMAAIGRTYIEKESGKLRLKYTSQMRRV